MKEGKGFRFVLLAAGLSIAAASSALGAQDIARPPEAGRLVPRLPLVIVIKAVGRDNDVILVRYRNEAFAFNLSCPHQNTALRWNESVMRFQCPRHHSQYQPDGEFITGRATRNMDRLAIRRDAANNIVVDVDTLYRSDDDAAEWSAAVVKL